MTVKKKGWIKFADPDKGYGYILASDAVDASDTTLFEMSDLRSTMLELRPGQEVEFEVETEADSHHARNVEVL